VPEDDPLQPADVPDTRPPVTRPSFSPETYARTYAVGHLRRVGGGEDRVDIIAEFMERCPEFVKALAQAYTDGYQNGKSRRPAVIPIQQMPFVVDNQAPDTELIRRHMEF
jgi:hypothetical protein